MTSRADPPASPLGRPTRRSLLTTAVAGAGALLAGTVVAGTGRTAHAASTRSPTDRREVITRTIGRTGERLPGIGLGVVTSLDQRPGARRAHLREVLSAYRQAGGRVLDTSRLTAGAELLVGEVTTAVGISGDLFLTHRIGSTAEDPGESHMSHQLQASKVRLRRDRMDAVQVHNLAGAEAVIPMLARWKRAGRVRHVGVSHAATRYYPAIEILIRNFDIDVVQIRYSILTRMAEEQILPLAAARGVGVIVTMPMEQGRLLELVEGHQVPAWAADFDATTWAQFFLKYVLAHPGVTVVLPSTGSLAHLAENMRVLRGPLPDAEQRTRMVAHMAAIAGFARLENESGRPG